MIHYHGTPLTPRAQLLRLAGRHFCVPFPNPNDAKTCIEIGQSVMFDNGAFSAYTKGIPLDVDGYYKWIEPMLGHPHWGVVPDVIGGDEQEQRRLVGTWPFAKELGAPVWHIDLSIDHLLQLTQWWPRICFGSAGAYWQVGSPSWMRRIDEAFEALAKRHQQLPWIHMLRGLDQAGKHYPFASADSVNVARNHNSGGFDVTRAVQRIDSVQCPVKWVPATKQEEMFA